MIAQGLHFTTNANFTSDKRPVGFKPLESARNRISTNS